MRGRRYVKLYNNLTRREYMTHLFWERAEKGDEDQCWLWRGSFNHKGYGKLGFTQRVSGRYISICAHRLSYRLFRGKMPKNICVLHDCDNPPCVNPKHLFLGTNGDNVADMVQKGRQAKGVKKWGAKFSEDQVREIRRCYAAGEASQKELAAEYGVETGTMCHLLQKHTWAHVNVSEEEQTRIDTVRKDSRRALSNINGKLTDAQVLKIREEYIPGLITMQDLADRYDVSRSLICVIVNGKARKTSADEN